MEQNKVIVRQLIEDFFNTGDSRLAEEVLSEDYIDHSPSHPDVSGPENVKQAVSEWRGAFPDTVSVVQDMVAEGDRVAARWTTQATHQGEFMGFAPSGNRIEVTWFGIFHLSEGEIVESWDTFNVIELLHQLKS